MAAERAIREELPDLRHPIEVAVTRAQDAAFDLHEKLIETGEASLDAVRLCREELAAVVADLDGFLVTPVH